MAKIGRREVYKQLPALDTREKNLRRRLIEARGQEEFGDTFAALYFFAVFWITTVTAVRWRRLYKLSLN